MIKNANLKISGSDASEVTLLPASRSMQNLRAGCSGKPAREPGTSQSLQILPELHTLWYLLERSASRLSHLPTSSIMKIHSVLLLLSLLAAALFPASTSAAPPNLLFIAVDDLRPQMGCYGETWMKTPRMDALAASGMRFDRHYVQFAVCIPSRAALLTSLRSERTRQVYGPLIWQQTQGAKGAGRWFSEQGYHTIALGKIWHSPDVKNGDRFDDYDPAKLPLAPQPQFPQGAPEVARNYGIPDYSDVPEGGGPKAVFGEATERHLIHGYAACTTFTDAQIGRVLDELKTLDLDKNTLVVLWGDHGWFLGDVGQWQKHSNFERAARSPLIVSGPGVKAGSVCDRFVESVDIFPTMLDYAGLKPFPLSDGKSFKPLLSDPAQPWKDRAYHIFNRGKNTIGYAVRTDSARYVEWHRGWGLDTPIVAREFYRYTAAQPDEVRNEVDDAANQADLEEHAAMLRELKF
jgi:arylsulfatase A-like enzyme